MALFFPGFEFRTKCVLQRSAEKTSLDLNFEMHNLGPFFLSESQLLLEYSLTSCWVSPHHQHVDTGNYCHKCTCVQTCNRRKSHDDLLPLAYQRQRILALVAGLASRLVELFTSVCPFPVGTEENACSLPFSLCSLFTAGLRPDPFALSTSSAVVYRFPEARVCRKLQDYPLEQDPVAFH